MKILRNVFQNSHYINVSKIKKKKMKYNVLKIRKLAKVSSI